jgi:hypothetical protein
MGRKGAFEEILSLIEDDYLYRNEDIVLAKLIGQFGFRYGRVDDVYHYHQIMQKRSTWRRSIKSVSLDLDMSREEQIRTCIMQAKGLVKYLEPDQELVRGVQANVRRLLELGVLDWGEFRQWVIDTNPVWWKHVKGIRHASFKQRLSAFLKAAYHLVSG